MFSLSFARGTNLLVFARGTTKGKITCFLFFLTTRGMDVLLVEARLYFRERHGLSDKEKFFPPHGLAYARGTAVPPAKGENAFFPSVRSIDLLLVEARSCLSERKNVFWFNFLPSFFVKTCVGRNLSTWYLVWKISTQGNQR